MANLPSASAIIPLIPLLALVIRDLLGYPPFGLLVKNSERFADLMALVAVIGLGAVIRLLLALTPHVSSGQTCIIFFVWTITTNVTISYLARLLGVLSFSTLPVRFLHLFRAH